MCLLHRTPSADSYSAARQDRAPFCGACGVCADDSFTRAAVIAGSAIKRYPAWVSISSTNSIRKIIIISCQTGPGLPGASPLSDEVLLGSRAASDAKCPSHRHQMTFTRANLLLE